MYDFVYMLDLMEANLTLKYNLLPSLMLLMCRA